MKKLLSAIAFACLSICAHAQNLTTVSGSNIQDLNGTKLAVGQLCFQATDNSDQPISFQIGGGGQALRRQYCSSVAAGVVTGFTVPNPANTLPSGIYYRVTVKDSSTGVEVLRYIGVTFAGATFNFDTYTPVLAGATLAPLTGTSVSGNLAVTGNIAATGTVTGSNIAGGQIATGAGTTNLIPKYTNGASAIIGNSSITDNGTTVSTTEPVSAPSLASSAANPAASGVLRCPNNTSCVAARNAANGADIVLAQLDGSNVELLGAPVRIVEAAAPSGVASSDLIYPDSTAHRWKMNNNNGGADTVVGAATTDTLTNKTLVSATSGNNTDLITVCTQNNLAPVTGTGADIPFFSCTIPANTVGTNKWMEITVAWLHSTGTANITYHMNFGGVLISNYGAIVDAASSNFVLETSFLNLGTTVAKLDKYLAKNTAGFVIGGTNYGTGLAVNLTSAQLLTFSFNVANTDAVTPQMLVVRVHQ